MRQKDFWNLIKAAAKQRGDGDAQVEALVRELAGLPPADITGFADHLARALYELDTPAHATAANAHGDAFLFIRCAVVLAGRTAYLRVRRNPADMAAFVGADAEPLLTVAGRAYQVATGMAWEHDTPVSYETGASQGAWGSAPPSPSGEPPPEPVWLTLRYSSAIHPLPRPAYGDTFRGLGAALDADPAWQRWWRAAGVPHLEAWLHFNPMRPPRATVLPGRRVVSAELHTDEQPFTTTDHAALSRRAVDDVTAIMKTVQEALHLPALPDVPPAPDLRADLPDTYGSPFDDLAGLLAGAKAVAELAQHHRYITAEMVEELLEARNRGDAGR
jgi:hypothetical protein